MLVLDFFFLVHTKFTVYKAVQLVVIVKPQRSFSFFLFLRSWLVLLSCNSFDSTSHPKWNATITDQKEADGGFDEFSQFVLKCVIPMPKLTNGFWQRPVTASTQKPPLKVNLIIQESQAEDYLLDSIPVKRRQA